MVFPIYDDNPFNRARLPYVTWGLIALNLIVFACEMTATGPSSKALLAALATTPAAVLHRSPAPLGVPPELTLVTYMFLHGGWEHILGNMIYLWVFGDDIEDALGPVRFLVFYLLVGIAAALTFVALNPRSTVPLIGASGAVSGIIAAYLLLRPCAKVAVFFFRIILRVRAYWVIGAWIALQIYQIVNRADDGVAYLAHGGGLAAGLALFLLLKPAHVHLLECTDLRPGEQPKVAA